MEKTKSADSGGLLRTVALSAAGVRIKQPCATGRHLAHFSRLCQNYWMYEEKTTIQTADLPPGLAAACRQAGWTDLMPVQSLVLPALMARRDVMAQSRTGSGKTGAYLLPMLELLDVGEKRVQALVLCPTRELALQVEREAETLFAGSGFSAVALYGGVSFNRQAAALAEGRQVVVGTPGRILDHILRRSLDLAHVGILVLDEADRMLSIGFYPDIVSIERHLPANRLTCMFSATYPPHVLKLAEDFMREPEMISLSHDHVHVAEVEHMFCETVPMDKDRALVRLLETENPASAIIFCNTRANVHYVCGVLRGFGYNAGELSSDLSQAQREAVLRKVRDGTLRYLVSTDVAARGIDIPELSHVFLYEPPEEMESYIHRAGRTGRAGSAGTVISLVDVMESMELERIGRHYRIGLRKMDAPTDEDVARVAGERLRTLLESRLRGLTGLERMRVQRYAPLARQLAREEDEESLMLLALLLDAGHAETRGLNLFPALSATETTPAKSTRKKRRRSSGRRRKGHAEAGQDSACARPASEATKEDGDSGGA